MTDLLRAKEYFKTHLLYRPYLSKPYPTQEEELIRNKMSNIICNATITYKTTIKEYAELIHLSKPNNSDLENWVGGELAVKLFKEYQEIMAYFCQLHGCDTMDMYPPYNMITCPLELWNCCLEIQIKLNNTYKNDTEDDIDYLSMLKNFVETIGLFTKYI